MWKALTDREKIIAVLEVMASRETDLKVLISDEGHEFTSRLIAYDMGDPVSEQGKTPELIIGKVSPKEGNALIQADSEMVLEFPVKSLLCRINARCLRTNKEPPHGFVLSFPGSIEYTKTQGEEKYAHEMPEYVSVDFELRKEGGTSKVYSLNVLDCSSHGLDILITNKDFELVKILKPGKELKDISFYTESNVIKVDGIIRHITKIGAGKYQGFYVMGVESTKMIETCVTPDENDW
jgi:hypothetical protein